MAKFGLVDVLAIEAGNPQSGRQLPYPSLQRSFEMRLLLFIGVGLSLCSTPALAAQSAATTTLSCEAGVAIPGTESPNLHGHWDFLMVPRGAPSFGLMSIGFVGADYGGSLAPSRTAPVVIRAIALDGHKLHMTVASREGDVTFDGQLSAKGDTMCGTVTYHGGEKFPMIAHKRPSTYQSPSQAQRAMPQSSEPAHRN